MIKIVFFGSSEHSVIILQKLLEMADFQISVVITKIDKPIGRKQLITPNPVAAFAKTNNLKLFQIEEFTPNLRSKTYDLKPDLGLCVAFGPPYFTKDLINLFKYKIINIHPSPLPKYRGATPGPWQIINGETKSAITFFQIDELPDHGPIITQIPFEITPSETATSFYQKAFRLAADQLEFILKSYISHPKSLSPQNHSQKTYYPKFTKENARIDWNWDPDKINRFIRALNPWPIAWTYVQNQQYQTLKMKIFSAEIKDQKLIPKNIQIEGKKSTSWFEISTHYTIKKT